ncbi:ABC transporter ATP-binding protein [Phenylobacterium montanum]|uniref:ABC transporter ATP-binding protein n=1 Tax=Phenylobacterium montanum TaxID=2823693 RepID=A0A975G1J9_9CAUL|nr:ATP-binding cassette domain-containing protein [Caulobacter sp. S6]QUD89089.1 ABC transporter ATP-binding protein [Caulobacter sp. S6]
MIRFENVSKVYHTRSGERHTLRNASFTIDRGTALGICGANGAGKSTLLRMMAGVEYPTSGLIRRGMSISWPLGHASAFHTTLTGADNLRFVARIYGKHYSDLIDEVEDFARLGDYMKMPINTYSSGMRARLAFGVSLAINFDCYLVDEITSVGDVTFQERCTHALRERKERGTLIMVSHSPETLRTYCDTGATILDGRIRFFDTIDEAIDAHYASQAMALT